MTKNKGKLLAATSTFSTYGIEVRSCGLDIPEIQAENSIEIARMAVEQAYSMLHEPIVREDHSFYIDELGIPGPYMAYFEKRISTKRLLDILHPLVERTGHWEIAAAFCDEQGQLYEYSFTVPIVFEQEPRGDERQNWERLIRFSNETRVLAEYPEEERTHIWNRNYEQIALRICSQGT